MLKILAGVIILYIIICYLIPYLSFKKEIYYLNKTLVNLDNKKYKIIKNLKLENNINKYNQEYKIDYLIVSTYGIFLINKLIFKNKFSVIRGDYSKKTWHYRSFFRFVQTPVPSTWKNENYKFENPVLKLKEITELLTDDLISEEKIIPAVLIIPRIKIVNLIEKDIKKAKVIFPSSLYEFIQQYDKEIINEKEIEEIYNKLKNN